jgi:hypothetical protein
MTNISAVIKIALENAVLCRGAHGPKESYEYAEKMELVIKQAIKKKLLEALENIEDLEESIYDIIDELKIEE